MSPWQGGHSARGEGSLPRPWPLTPRQGPSPPGNPIAFLLARGDLSPSPAARTPRVREEGAILPRLLRRRGVLVTLTWGSVTARRPTNWRRRCTAPSALVAARAPAVAAPPPAAPRGIRSPPRAAAAAPSPLALRVAMGARSRRSRGALALPGARASASRLDEGSWTRRAPPAYCSSCPPWCARPHPVAQSRPHAAHLAGPALPPLTAARRISASSAASGGGGPGGDGRGTGGGERGKREAAWQPGRHDTQVVAVARLSRWLGVGGFGGGAVGSMGRVRKGAGGGGSGRGVGRDAGRSEAAPDAMIRFVPPPDELGIDCVRSQLMAPRGGGGAASSPPHHCRH